MRTVLVTGGAGFMGSHLVDHLLESGTVVRVLDNLSTGDLTNLQAAADRQSRVAGARYGSRLEVIIGDVRDRKLLRKALRNVKYVFHMAALTASAVSVTERGEIHAVNVEGTLNVLHGALTEGVWRVVLASCASVYGMPDTVPVPEDAPLRPSSLFAASKVAAETYCRAFHAGHQLDTIILRYFNVYGSRQRATAVDGLVPTFIESLREHRPFIQEDARAADDFTYVDDAVSATLAAARAPRAAGQVLNVGTGRMTSVGELLGVLADLLGTVTVPALSRRQDDPPRQVCARTTLAAELLDFVPRVSFRSGLGRVVRSITGAEPQERPSLASVGFDE